MTNPTYEQARSLLARWGYKQGDGDYAEYISSRFSGELWCGEKPSVFLPSPSAFETLVDDLFDALASRHGFTPPDIRRIMAAEPGGIPTPPGIPPMRQTGSIHLVTQQIDEFGQSEDHAPASIVMDELGRNQLIAALIEGRGSIDAYGESGGGYQLNLEIR